MVVFCATCRTRLHRLGSGWKHHKGEPADNHEVKPLAARRRHLFDPDVVRLAGYDRFLLHLVEKERAAGVPTEAWRVGVYVFDGRIKGSCTYTVPAEEVPADSPFKPPGTPGRQPLCDHPLVKERLAGMAPSS